MMPKSPLTPERVSPSPVRCHSWDVQTHCGRMQDTAATATCWGPQEERDHQAMATSQMGGRAIPLSQAASPAPSQPCDGSQGQGEDMELCGTRKLHTSWPQCPRHTYFISSTIVRAHKLNGSSTDVSQHPSKQRGLCCQTPAGFSLCILKV